MGKRIWTLAAVLSLFLAVVSLGPGLAEAFKDTLGYGLYISVFAAPTVYFWKKMEKEKKEKE